MRKVNPLIQSVRQESRIGQYFGAGVFVLATIAAIATHFQGRSTTANDLPSMMCIMLFGFIGLAYSRIMARLAEITEAIRDDYRPDNAP